MNDIKEMLDRYHTWLRERMTLRQVGDYIEITTPYIDRHNDYLQIYAKRDNGSFLLTDDGYILNDLEQSGCKISSPKRQQLLEMTINGFGIRRNGKELQVLASNDNFSLKKHNLVQAMLAINDMFYLAEPLVTSIFLEDVTSWLDLHDIRYTPQIKLTGKSGFDHSFNFVIPKSRNNPERIIEVLNHPGKNEVTSLAFAWVDTQETRPQESKAMAILNDQEQVISSEILDALRNYEVTPVLWSHREDFLPLLAS